MNQLLDRIQYLIFALGLLVSSSAEGGLLFVPFVPARLA